MADQGRKRYRFLGDHSVRLWTVLGGIAGVIAVIVTLVLAVPTLFASGSPASSSTPASATTSSPPASPTIATPSSSPSTGPSTAVAGGDVHLALCSGVPNPMVLRMQSLQCLSGFSINGKTYDLGWSWNVPTLCGSPAFVEIDLGRRYTKFRARIGLAQTSVDTTAHASVTIDGRVTTYALTLQKSQDLDLDVTGALRLRIDLKSLAQRCGVFGVGDPVVS